MVDVTLTSDNLRTLTVVDTPGLSSTSTAVSEGARRALLGEDLDDDSAGAILGAEAIVYVFTQAVRADDLQALEAFRAVVGPTGQQPDQLARAVQQGGQAGRRGGRPVAGGRPARRRPGPGAAPGGLRRGPVVGLLAETTEAGRLTAADCEALRALAGLPAAERRVLLASVDLFPPGCPVAREQRERLLRRLDLYGIGFALAQLGRAAPAGQR